MAGRDAERTGDTAGERFREALSAVPVKNARVSESPVPGDPDRVELRVPLRYRSAPMRAAAALFGLASEKRLRLDRIGTGVWRRIDGKTMFGDLVAEFAERECLGFFEARALLGPYLQTLAKNGLVVAGVKSAGGGGPG